MNIDSFKFLSNSLFSNPGVNWCFIFNKNSFKNKELRFVIIDPEEWSDDSVLEKTNWSGWFGETCELIPLNPLIHPVKELKVFPVYVITSSLIFNNPYFSGNPFVPVGVEDILTKIVSSIEEISLNKIPDSAWEVISSILIYLSMFWIKSIGAPWNSWAR